MSSTEKSKKGPIKNTQGIPYDYIIIIDSGSSGSRAYIYNWLNGESLHDVNLIARVADDDDDDSDDSDDSGEDMDDEDSSDEYKLPKVRTKPKWHKKIKPGISSFNETPNKVGKDHIKILLDKVGKIIPRSQHSRTPIFLHATAGMRLLKPEESDTILTKICQYVQKNYDYYLPDCSSHINIIDGDVEGLYGWIALNYLMGSFDKPMLHDHGKNHSTYGLLDMGGASTQICFQPNSTEELEHANALFKIQLLSIGQYEPDLNYNVFSASFLGYGMYQLHENYLAHLQNDDESIHADPCLPKGLQSDNNITGAGNFSQCMDLIYPLLIESENSDMASCSKKPSSDISSCLLSNSIPSLDFDVDKFIGVSGYWDAISNMLGIENISKYGNAYDYKSFYVETERICETPWEELDHYNDDDIKTIFGVLSDDELKELCFKSSWILNVLHRGLGFPKLQVNDANQITPFQVAELIHGSEFSWTLGRAILYSTWENAKYYSHGDEDVKIGYYHASSPNLFIYGGERKGIDARPRYIKLIHNDEDNDDWDLDEVHKSWTSLLFLIVFVLILYLILGSKKRMIIYKSFKKTLYNLAKKLKIPVKATKYMRLNELELDELHNRQSNNEVVDLERQNDEIDETFNISDNDEDDDRHIRN